MGKPGPRTCPTGWEGPWCDQSPVDLPPPCCSVRLRCSILIRWILKCGCLLLPIFGIWRFARWCCLIGKLVYSSDLLSPARLEFPGQSAADSESWLFQPALPTRFSRLASALRRYLGQLSEFQLLALCHLAGPALLAPLWAPHRLSWELIQREGRSCSPKALSFASLQKDSLV